MQRAEDSCQIRILEIYASEDAYQQHLKTDHFQKYKQGTLHMVKDLKLPTMKPLDPEQKILSFLAAMLFCCCSADSEMKAQNMEQRQIADNEK